VLQRNLSKVFPNKLAASIAEGTLLIMLGAFAALLHSWLRVPLHLPGRQGLIFMAIIIVGKSLSEFRFASSLSCLSAAGILWINFLGFHDIFMPLNYLILGFVLDVLFLLPLKKPFIFIISLFGGLAWMVLPLLKLIEMQLTGIPEGAFATGLLYPFATHFLFGFCGVLLGFSMVRIFQKEK